MQNHIGLSKSNIKELKRGFHAMKFGSLRLNFIQNTKHLKIRIRFQTGIFFCPFVQKNRSNLNRK